MVEKSHSQRARAYMRAHPGVKYQQALDIVRLESEDALPAVNLGPCELFTALGIEDIRAYDPVKVWESNAFSDTFRIPIGHKYTDHKTNELAYLDMIEMSQGGTGPHGCMQGVTGSGKSYLLNGLVLSMCTLYGPDKVAFILADFKGGYTFKGFEQLPHVSVNLEAAERSPDLVLRLTSVIDGEILRREKLLQYHSCRDALAYRKLCSKDSSFTPLPDLFIIADEFREFMQEYREYLDIFPRIGAVGRSLGIRLLLCSQYIDAVQLRGLMEHLTFGISLRTSSDNYSRVVIGNTEAAKLPLGTGQAILRESTPGVSEGKTIKFVGLSLEGSTENASSAPKDALIDKLSDTGARLALEMWTPSLSKPMTLLDIPHEPRNISDGLIIPVGVLDDPRTHTRRPYELNLDENTVIVGDNRSGKSTAVITAIASSALAYPNDVDWLIIDRYGQLAAVREFPNVVGYTSSENRNTISEYLTEISTVLEYRKKHTGSEITDRTDPEDPYGHLIIAIDGEAKFITDDDELADSLINLMKEGPRYGINVIGTVPNGSGVWRLTVKRVLILLVPLKVSNPSELGNVDYVFSARMKLVPSQQPGRGIDLVSGLEFLIAIPLLKEIMPVSKGDLRDVYNYCADYSSEIRAWGAGLPRRKTYPPGIGIPKRL
jgi:S-DNA-T family DNA segregation ATPase FtsK/SpoIIIE